jgi:hypothetical protein
VIRKYSTAAGVTYKYKMRLRTDAVFLAPLPPVDTYDFGPPPPSLDKKYYNRHLPTDRSFPDCTRSLLMPNVAVMHGGNEDSWNFGLAADMDPRLDEFEAFTMGGPAFMNDVMTVVWSHEGFLTQMLAGNHRICIKADERVKMILARRAKVRGVCIQKPPFSPASPPHTAAPAAYQEEQAALEELSVSRAVPLEKHLYFEINGQKVHTQLPNEPNDR